VDPPETVQLTRGPTSVSQVDARPDGRGLLAYGTVYRGELTRYSREARRFEPFMGGESAGMVQPSADGEWLAWATFPQNDLWRSRRDGTERLRLTTDTERGWMPSWSPDGKWIGFVGSEPTYSSLDLMVVSADGGPVETVLRAESSTGWWDPCWLPDGSLVFSDLNWDKKGIRRLDWKTRAVTTLPGAEDLVSPKCGPQGQLLAVRPAGVGEASRPAAQVVHWPDRGTWEEAGPWSLAYPTWSRDGQSYCGLAIEENRIDCYSFATRRTETIAEVGDNPLLTWVVVPGLGLDADDNPLVMLDRSTRDLYALDWEAP